VADIEHIGRALSGYRGRRIERPGVGRAAVAMVLRARARDHPEVLLIERARRRGDPWSGHMAFPGGRMDPADASLEAAAVRETREEVGLGLEGARPLGRLDDLEGRHAGRPAGLVISAFVYHHAAAEPLVTNHEVASAMWVPVWELGARERHVDHPYPGIDRIFPGILVGEPGRHVVWGLTYRFIEVFYAAVSRPFPDRWSDLRIAP
jgi:8-oxo-dGTP pyrophosphatase MutT (NUDIX family)